VMFLSACRPALPARPPREPASSFVDVGVSPGNRLEPRQRWQGRVPFPVLAGVMVAALPTPGVVIGQTRPFPALRANHRRPSGGHKSSTRHPRAWAICTARPTFGSRFPDTTGLMAVSRTPTLVASSSWVMPRASSVSLKRHRILVKRVLPLGRVPEEYLRHLATGVLVPDLAAEGGTRPPWGNILARV
jgi:hypothetical protein